jgi:hypothetical protein
MQRMRTLVLSFLVFLLSLQILSQTPAPSDSRAASTAANNLPVEHAPVNCTNRGTYVNSKGETVKRPEHCSSAPNGTTARCRDGTYSFSQSRRGTCSHHGGVAPWL